MEKRRVGEEEMEGGGPGWSGHQLAGLSALATQFKTDWLLQLKVVGVHLMEYFQEHVASLQRAGGQQAGLQAQCGHCC